MTSSQVNFCEKDIKDVGEPYNILTSFFISGCGLYGLHEYDIYNVNDGRILYWILYLIGIGSAYFHYELSEFSHFIDIVLISCILTYALYVLDKQNYLIYISFLMLHIMSALIIPTIHIFILFGTGFVLQQMVHKNIMLKNDLVLNSRYRTIKYLFYASLVFWIIDYFGCKMINPYHTHWIFHILIGITSYKIINLTSLII